MILLILFPVIVKAEFICLSLENGFLLSQKMPEAPTIDLIYKKIKWDFSTWDPELDCCH